MALADDAFNSMLAGLGGASDATVARASGLNRSTVGRLRRGEIRNPSLNCVVRIERACRSLAPSIVARVRQNFR
jgi:hypothetical protein